MSVGRSDAARRTRGLVPPAVLCVVMATTACGADTQRVEAELARVKASASASALDAERQWRTAEAEASAQAAQEAAATATGTSSVPMPSAETGDPDSPGSPGSPGSPAGARLPRTAAAGAGPHAGAADAATSLAAVEARVGPIGVAVVPVGGGAALTYGSVTEGVAWSTIKVPLSVAAVRADGGHPLPATSALIRRAITVSDNAAAEALWSRLGGGARASAAVGAVLADGGDAQTRVPSRRLRAGFTVFGQTPWPLTRAASYAAHLPCQRGAGPVVTQMGRISAGQRWGLGVLGSSVRFKGGWGPDPGGAYLVRQLGVMTLPSGGQVGVAIASRPTSGSFWDGAAALTAVARWLAGRAGSLTGGRC